MELIEIVENFSPTQLPWEDSAFQVQASIPEFSGPSVFTPARIPTGIVVDAQGNVIIQSDDQFGATTKLSPTGQILNQVPTPGGLLSLERRFARDRQTGVIVALNRAGLLSILDSNTLQEQAVGYIDNIPIDVSRVYDVASNTVMNASSFIIPQQATFGDIDIVSGAGFTDLYISGISVAFPFVMRMRLSQDGTVDAEVIAMSLASGAPNDNSPPGIAVNSQGVVLTTLTTGNATGTFSVPVFFSTDFSAGRGTIAPTILGNNQLFVSSRGMATDASGNFYIATSSIGVTGGGFSGGGVVVAIDSTLDTYQILGQSSSVLNGLVDVAVDDTGTRVYATQNGFSIFPGSDQVIAFQASTAQASDILTGIENDGAILTESVELEKVASDALMLSDLPEKTLPLVLGASDMYLEPLSSDIGSVVPLHKVDSPALAELSAFPSESLVLP
ncbi:MAG: hypothetical protein AAF572_17540 [Cyanobacteria bacterium P01_B01_bin.77]